MDPSHLNERNNTVRKVTVKTEFKVINEIFAARAISRHHQKNIEYKQFVALPLSNIFKTNNEHVGRFTENSGQISLP